MSALSFQRINRDSLFTRLDFRSKLLFMVVATIIAFLWESPVLGGGLALVVLCGCLVAGIQISYIRRVIGFMVPFYIMVIGIQGFFAAPVITARTGQPILTPLFSLPEHWWVIGGSVFSLEGFLYALNIIFKTLTLTLVLPLAIFTTDVNNMVLGMVRLHIPYRIAFVFSSTLRFFPLLFQEAQTILEAQRLRGLALENMRGFARLRTYAKVAVPLFLNTMVKSQMLDVVLQSKAFSGEEQRTYLHESKLRPADYMLSAISLLFFILALVSYFLFDVGRFGGPI